MQAIGLVIVDERVGWGGVPPSFCSAVPARTRLTGDGKSTIMPWHFRSSGMTRCAADVPSTPTYGPDLRLRSNWRLHLFRTVRGRDDQEEL